ncbi:hypothetical protein [Streptomyces sp. NPDC054842]
MAFAVEAPRPGPEFRLGEFSSGLGEALEGLVVGRQAEAFLILEVGGQAEVGDGTLGEDDQRVLVGLTVGTYSSMFTATPMAIELHRRRR